MKLTFDPTYVVVFYMIAALGAFLIGFKLLSENLQRVANKGLRRLFDRTSKNKLAGVGIGAGATILMQSSGATTVMVIGFVNAGILSLAQATAIIMGANIGTTVTTILLALGMANIGDYFMILAFIGIFVAMICKNGKVRSWGLTAAGFGLVFFGLTIISGCSTALNQNPALQNILRMEIKPAFLEPFVLLLIGALITAVMQSSTAVNAILLSMLTAGMQIGNGGNAILYLVLGTNIGTCVTALISSMGATTNAKRAALIHFLFNFCGSIIFLIVLSCIPNFMESFWIPLIHFGDPQMSARMQLAIFHLAFNSICTIIFLPLTNVIVKTTEFLIRDKKQKEIMHISYMDERILSTPAIAIAQLQKETLAMGNKCMNALGKSFNAFIACDTTVAEDINAENEEINLISKQITDYLIKVSGENVSVHDDQKISIMYHAIVDMLRISEISDNFVKYTRSYSEKGLKFSDNVFTDLKVMYQKLVDMYDFAIKIFETFDKTKFGELEEMENSVDGMRKMLIDGHIRRLNEGSCTPESSSVFINLVSNLERVGDHITFIAHTVEELQ